MPDQKALVTIVTVTFNAANDLEKTIKSIISQDYTNLEYIIIDGGSQDDTLEIIKKYEAHIHYWRSEPDNGIYDAMNKGIARATGEWINFMNAGDSFIDDNTISKISSFFDSQTDIIAGGIYYDDNEHKQFRPAKGIEQAESLMFCHHQALFTRTSLMKQYFFNTTFQIAADYDFLMRCLTEGKNFNILDFPVATFISGGESEKNKIQARIEDLFIQSRYMEKIENIFNSASFNKLVSYGSNNNWSLTILMNKLYSEFDRLDLRNKRFALYGFGHIGKLIYSHFNKNIPLIVDKNDKYIQNNSEARVRGIESLKEKEFDFDFVLISVLGREREIMKNLTDNFSIKKHKILMLDI